LSDIGKIGIIGNGSWGTALAKILTDNGNQVRWWIRNKDAIQYLNTRHHNPHYLTSVKFEPGSILPTDQLEELFLHCDTLIFCVPAAYSEQILSQFSTGRLQGKNIISAIKGVLPFCNQLLNDYLVSRFALDQDRYVAITGPCHAEEVAAERLSYLTFSGLNTELTASVAAAFRNAYLRTTYNHDIWGAQFAAVLKNIYALGAGIAHALDYGDNFLSVYVTNCYREMYHFLQQHFDKVHPSDERPDFHTSAYLGDLLVTGYSLHSRNRRFGVMIGKGYSVDAAILEMNMVAEGYHASKCMQVISSEYGIALPIAGSIYDILWHRKDPQQIFTAMESILS
jgi:glycerol-3-phosphate dehydrogenase (NAD(P)+)